MKTNYFLITMLLLLSMTSCSTYYRMTSRVERDGSMYREIYAQGDSAFIAGDKTHNPFLFQLDTDWQIVNLDSTLKFNFWGEEEKLNVKACRNIPLINGEYFFDSSFFRFRSCQFLLGLKYIFIRSHAGSIHIKNFRTKDRSLLTNI